MSNGTALVVIDAQVNMFAPGAAVYGAEDVLGRLVDLVARARAAQVPVIFVQNNGEEGDPDVPGTPGWEISPALKPLADEPVIQKTTPNSFYKTSLQAELEKRNVRHLVIAGMQSEFCIDTTTRQAAALDYKLTLVEDAHSTYDSETLTAQQISAHHNRVLRFCARLKTSAEVDFS